VPGLLRALVSLPPGFEPDVDTARQIAWAWDVLYSEWDPKPANRAQIERVFNRMRLRLKLDPFFTREQWAAASQELDPAQHKELDPEEAQRRRKQLAERRQGLSQNELDQFLSRAAEYRPAVFKNDLQNLLRSLPAE
jgi:hypothetical protein